MEAAQDRIVKPETPRSHRRGAVVSPYFRRKPLRRPARQRAKWFAEYRRALIATYQLTTPLELEDGYRLAALHVERKVAGQELGAARQQREEGTGRRPSVARIAQLQKRANLADKAFMAAWQRFEAKYGNGRAAPRLSPSELLAQMQIEDGDDAE